MCDQPDCAHSSVFDLASQDKDPSELVSTLTALEMQCEVDWETLNSSLEAANQAVLQTVASSFRDIRQRAKAYYDQTKRELKDWRGRLQRTVAADRPGSLFRVMIGDCRVAVAEAILERVQFLPADLKVDFEAVQRERETARILNFAEDQVWKGRADLAEQALEYAKELGCDSQAEYKSAAARLKRKVTLRRLGLLPDLASQEEVREAVEGLVEAGRKACTTGSFETAVKKLQLALAQLQCLDCPGFCLQLITALAQLHFQAGQWEETIAVCMQVQQAWSSLSGFEPCCVLYYLSRSHSYLGSQDLQFATEWTAHLAADSAESQCVLLLIKATQLLEAGNQAEAATGYEQALAMNLYLQPHSYLIACSRLALGAVYEKAGNTVQAGEQYVSARVLFSALYPQSIGLANCLVNMGGFYQNTLQRFEQAETLYVEAEQIYALRYPKSVNYAQCLLNLGTLCGRVQRDRDAEKWWLKTEAVCLESFPQSVQLASCLLNLGFLYQNTKNQPDKADDYSSRASALFAAHYPHSPEYAQCLKNRGLLSFQANQFEAAEQHWLQACKIWTEANPQALQLAHCRFNLGVLYQSRTDQRDLAKDQYVQAAEIYAEASVQSLDLANCYCGLARLEEALDRPLHAEEQYLKAQMILNQNFPVSEERAAMLLGLGWLYQNSLNRVDEAEQLFLAALEIYPLFPPAPDQAQCLINLGLIYDSRDRQDLAATHWLRSSYLCSAYFPLEAHFPNSVFNLGLVYQDKGEIELAALMFEKALVKYIAVEMENDSVTLLRDQYN